jgi:hypothetical protein
MSKVRNRTDGPRDLIVPGFEAHVEAGETVEVPDFQPDGVSPIVYPEATWEPVAEPKVKPEKAAKAADGTAA